MGIGSAYERELRSVLAGEEKGVRAVTRSCSEYERAQAMQICQRPFLVVRAPGSGLETIGLKCSIQPFYAYRLKGVRGDSWRIFRVRIDGLTGRSRLLARSVPELPLTRNGTPYLDWHKGLPLHKFLSLVAKSESAKNIGSNTVSTKIYSEIVNSLTNQPDSSSPERNASSLSNS